MIGLLDHGLAYQSARACQGMSCNLVLELHSTQCRESWHCVALHMQVIPRVNSVGPWGVDTRSKDRDRLQCRLDFYALAERQVKGDGNCQVSMPSRRLHMIDCLKVPGRMFKLTWGRQGAAICDALSNTTVSPPLASKSTDTSRNQLCICTVTDKTDTCFDCVLAVQSPV